MTWSVWDGGVKPLSSPLRCEVLAPWADEASTWPSRTSAPALPSPLCGCTTSVAWVWAVTWRCSPMWWRALTRPLWWRSGASVWIMQRRGTLPRCTAAQRGSGWCPSGGVCAPPDSKNTETPVWVSGLGAFSYLIISKELWCVFASLVRFV